MASEYREEMRERLAKIEEQNKNIFKDIREIKLQMQIANGRTRTLENRTSLIFGAGGILMVVVPVIINLIMGV